jgi:hypothetical protein
MTAQTVTFTVSAEDAVWVRIALTDSASHWHELWRECRDGSRADLDPDSCQSISRRAWRLWQELSQQEMLQIP